MMGLFERGSREAAVEFDKEYEDEITGFKGVATGVTKFRNGCVQVLLEARSIDGKKGETVWFDDTQLSAVTIQKNGPGGPSPSTPTPSQGRA